MGKQEKRASCRRNIFSVLLLANLLFCLNLISAVNVGISPATINFKNVMREGYAEANLFISADSEDPVNIELTPRGEIAYWLNFSSSDLFVGKDAPLSVKISVSPPKDTPNGNYTGFLRVMTSAFGEGIEEHAVARAISSLDLVLNVEVVDFEIIECSVSKLEIISAEKGDEVIIKMDIENEGNIKLNPTVLMDIWDQDQMEILETEDFIGKSLLPTTKNKFEFRLKSNNLDLGQYWSDISVLECLHSSTHTFDILEEGALKAKGLLLNIVTRNVMVDDTAIIYADFKNIGEKEVEAQFKGKVTLGGRIMQILESEKIKVPISEIEKFDFYFTPKKAGEYVVSGRVYYDSKKTFESSSIFQAISREKNFLLPLIYFSFIVSIGVLYYKIRKEKKIYLDKLKNLQ